MTNERIEEQRNYQQEYQNVLAQETLENAEHEKKLVVKERSLTNLMSHVADLTAAITNNKFRNETLNEKIRQNQNQLKELKSELKKIEKNFIFFKNNHNLLIIKFSKK